MARSCRSVTAASAKRTIRPWTGRRSAPAPEVADNRGMSVTTPSDVEALRAEIETLRGDGDHARLPEAVRAFNRGANIDTLLVAPLKLAPKTLGWIALANSNTPVDDDGGVRRYSECERGWRRAVLDATARQATLALYYSR